MKVILSKKAEKEFLRIPKQEQKKIQRKLLATSENPLGGKKLTGELEGSRSIRAWPYRIIYKINADKHQIEVSDIVHRQGAYK